jgi:hypothetical protein
MLDVNPEALGVQSFPQLFHDDDGPMFSSSATEGDGETAFALAIVLRQSQFQ